MEYRRGFPNPLRSMAVASVMLLTWDLFHLVEQGRANPIGTGRMISDAAFLVLYLMGSPLAWNVIFGLAFLFAPIYVWMTFTGMSPPIRYQSTIYIWVMAWSAVLVYLWKVRGSYLRWTEMQAVGARLR